MNLFSAFQLNLYREPGGDLKCIFALIKQQFCIIVAAASSLLIFSLLSMEINESDHEEYMEEEIETIAVAHVVEKEMLDSDEMRERAVI